jgi:hypothetical protein
MVRRAGSEVVDLLTNGITAAELALMEWRIGEESGAEKPEHDAKEAYRNVVRLLALADEEHFCDADRDQIRLKRAKLENMLLGFQISHHRRGTQTESSRAYQRRFRKKK